jgi:hypothetical protein
MVTFSSTLSAHHSDVPKCEGERLGELYTGEKCGAGVHTEIGNAPHAESMERSSRMLDEEGLARRGER